MANGYVYALAEPLVYTDETAAKVLGCERMRHDFAALLPELDNNEIRASKDVVFCSGSDYPYFDNLVTSEAGETYYLRVFDCRPTEDSELYLDYLEWVPKSVYANPNEVEDIW